MSKIMTAQEAISHIKNDAVVHVGGFYALGTPDDLIDEMISNKINGLTVITNDTGTPTEGVGKLLGAGCIKQLICSYVGLTPVVPELIESKQLAVELVPQGTLIERIRCAGFGLGGVLTPTGLGTHLEENKQTVELNNQRWMYDTPLKADVAILEAYTADTEGNLIFKGTQRNFSNMMATAADLTIASIVEPIVEAGALDPDCIVVPGIYVDILVLRGE